MEKYKSIMKMNKINNNILFTRKYRILINEVYKGGFMMRYMENIKDIKFTDIGYGYKTFRVFDPFKNKWVKEGVKVRGIFSLLPEDKVFFVRVYKVKGYNEQKAPFDFRTYMKIVRRAIDSKTGYPLAWKDTGLKDSKGEWRLLPFAKFDFSIRDWFDKLAKFPSDAFGTKGAKMMKYLTQPVDWRRRENIRVLVVPIELLNADGCGYSQKKLFGVRGVVKGMGIGYNDEGEGAVFKGIAKAGYDYSDSIPSDVMKEIENHGFRSGDYDVIATTDTMKFSKEWKIYNVEWFWHDDSTRNVHNTILLSEQILRNVGEFDKDIENRLMKILDTRMEELEYILSLDPRLRGIALALWINPILEEANIDPEGNDDTIIIGEITRLLATGLPITWAPGTRGTDLLHKISIGIGSFIRRRTIGSIKINGALGFVIANNNVERNTVLIPYRWAKRNNVKIGNIVTVIKSPVCARSIMTFKVAGFTDGNWIEKNPADAFNHDFDGDKVMVIKGSLSADPYHYKIDNVKKNIYENELEGIIKECEIDINIKINEDDSRIDKYIKTLIKNFITLDQSNGVGLFSYNRGIWETTGMGTSDEDIKIKTSLAFQMIEEGALIKAKKHAATYIDLKKLISRVKYWIHGNIDVNKQLGRLTLTGKNKNIERIKNGLEGKRWNKKNRKYELVGDGIDVMKFEGLPMADIYEKGMEIGKLIIKAFDRSEYIDSYKKFKKDWFRYWMTVVDWAKKNNIPAARYFIGVNASGELSRMVVKSKTFWRMATNNIDNITTEEKNRFREAEKEWFAKFDPISRRVFLVWIINQEIYSWIYYFTPSEIMRVIMKSGLVNRDEFEDINIHMKRIMNKKSMIQIGEDIEIVEAISTILDSLMNAVDNDNDDDDPTPDIELYIDGSWSANNPKVTGWGVCSSDGKIELYGSIENEEATKLHQIVGELKATIEAVRYAKSKGYTRITIKHDYLGVAKWVTGEWKAKNSITKKYANWMRKQKIKIDFVKVSAGANPADVLARIATGAKYSH